MKKQCKNCAYFIDEPRTIDNSEEKLKMATTFETGKNIYRAILDHRFRSIDLCNWCYSVMKAYRHTLPKEERDYKETPTPPVNESWEKDFDKKFEDGAKETIALYFDDGQWIPARVHHIKDFIRTLLSTARQEERERIKQSLVKLENRTGYLSANDLSTLIKEIDSRTKLQEMK